MKLPSRFLALVLIQAMLAISTLVEATAQSQVARSVGTPLSYEASEEVPRIAQAEPAPETSGPNSRFGLAASFAVTNTNDTGAGSLRKAIQDANASPGLDIIGFAVGSGGPAVISLKSELPFITSPVVIDGTTQGGYAGSPLITIDGANIAGYADGLYFTPNARVSTVRSIVIGAFTGNGITLNADSCIVEGCYIGTTANGLFAHGNSGVGIFAQDASHCRIGGTTAAQKNVLSGNAQFGILLRGNCTLDTIQGNNVGTDVNGSYNVKNGWDGVRLNRYNATGYGANNCLVGGTTPGASNIIAGNDSGGVVLNGISVINNRVIGNFIGTNPSGSATIGNGGDGVRFYNSGTGGTASSNSIGGILPLEGNVIAANHGNGIGITAGTGGGGTNNRILGNRIGVFPPYSGSLGNSRHGIAIGSPFGGTIVGTLIGGVTGDSSNTIADNHGSGVSLKGSGVSATRIIGNSIYGNDSLGIDLGGNGVSPNDPLDADSGPNGLQNYPIIDSVTASGVLASFRLTLNSASSQTFKVSLYANAPVAPPHVPQGETYIQSLDITTDLFGYAMFTFITTSIPPGQYLTLTATDANGNTSEFSPLPQPITLRRPLAGQLFIAGEKDTIKWIIRANISSVDIILDTNGVTIPQPIATIGPASNGQYIWEVPSDILSRKSHLTIRSSADPATKTTSDQFRIKGYVLTRLNANGDYERYFPDKDGWTMKNESGSMWPQPWFSQFDYRNGVDPNTGNRYDLPFMLFAPDSFPDWPLWTKTFGRSICYDTRTSDGTMFSRYDAMEAWDAHSGRWGGSCYGFAATSLLAFCYPDQFRSTYGMPAFASLFSYGTTLLDTSRVIINRLFNYQWGRERVAYASQTASQSTPLSVLRTLRSIFLSDANPGRQLTLIWGGSPGGGHALVPYKLVHNQQYRELWRVNVYDSNHPGDSTHAVVIDTVLNTWVYLDLAWVGTPRYLYLEPDLIDFLFTPTAGWTSAPNATLATAPAMSTNVRLMVNSSGNVSIRNSLGEQVQYADSLSLGIPDAFPLIPLVGGAQAPIGYLLPPDTYELRTTNDRSPSRSAVLLSDSCILSCRRTDADSSQTDVVRFSKGIVVQNPDLFQRHLILRTIVGSASGVRKGAEVSGVGLGAHDSISMTPLPTEDLILRTSGKSSTYDLRLSLMSSTNPQAFQHTGLSLDSLSTHRIVPQWSDLTGTPVKIYIDKGNDGTYEDSLTVQNETTSEKSRGALAVPLEFRLEQNYPNPFNPTTSIAYTVGGVGGQGLVVSDVRLVVYDILGREVATLVNERKAPGRYSVTFDASDLASGVYLYRLTAGKFVETKKMILIR